MTAHESATRPAAAVDPSGDQQPSCNGRLRAQRGAPSRHRPRALSHTPPSVRASALPGVLLHTLSCSLSRIVMASLLLAATACGLPAPPGLDDDSGGSGSSGEPAAVTAEEGLAGPVSSTATIKANAVAKEAQPSLEDATRFLAQASFGPVDLTEVMQVRDAGYEQWLDHQFSLVAPSHLTYITAQSARQSDGKPRDEMSYEAVWQQWLYSEAQLRARVAFALSEIFVISNIAPDLNPRAMSSYMDLLNIHAFGNYRTLLEAVTLHPAMGYYLNLLGSEKEDAVKNIHPNQNYAREVLQLFSVGLVRLNADGSAQLDGSGKPLPTYDQSVVQGYAKAFTGWSFGGRDTSRNEQFHNGPEDWVNSMQAWASRHSTTSKTLLDGRQLPAGQTPQQDLAQALDSIFVHPNVGPFIGRRLIQRLVTSNPSPDYIARVAAVFANNGAGQRGDLKAVVRAVLLDPEARATTRAPHFGKQREPVIRLANLLRVMNAKSLSGHTEIHDLDSADNGLGQSPLLAPSVFNFFAPDYRSPGPISDAGLSSPEFQITHETTVVGTLNFFARLVRSGGLGSGENRLQLDFGKYDTLAADAGTLIDHFNLLFMNGAMSAATRVSFMRTLNAIDPKNRKERIQAALTLVCLVPEFVIQQ